MVQRYPKSLKAIPWREHVPDLTYKEDIATTSEYLRKHFAVFDW